MAATCCCWALSWLRDRQGLDHFAFAVSRPAYGGRGFRDGVAVGHRIAAIHNGTFRFEDLRLFVVNSHAQITVDPFSILSFIACAGTLVVMLLSLDHFGENQLTRRSIMLF